MNSFVCEFTYFEFTVVIISLGSKWSSSNLFRDVKGVTSFSVSTDSPPPPLIIGWDQLLVSKCKPLSLQVWQLEGRFNDISKKEAWRSTWHHWILKGKTQEVLDQKEETNKKSYWKQNSHW